MRFAFRKIESIASCDLAGLAASEFESGPGSSREKPPSQAQWTGTSIPDTIEFQPGSVRRIRDSDTGRQPKVTELARPLAPRQPDSPCPGHLPARESEPIRTVN